VEIVVVVVAENIAAVVVVRVMVQVETIALIHIKGSYCGL
jgi:hypothetical protein